MGLLRAEVTKHILQGRQAQEESYNMRSRACVFEVEDVMVYERLFNLSRSTNGYNVKLDQKFVKAKTIGGIGTTQSRLEDSCNRVLGVNHVKDDTVYILLYLFK